MSISLRQVTAAVIFTLVLLPQPLLCQAKEASGPISRFWVAPGGEILVEETSARRNVWGRRRTLSKAALLRPLWPPTVLYTDLTDEQVLDSPEGSVHFVGGERFFAVTRQLRGKEGFRVLFWDGIDTVWRILAPMATLDPVVGVFSLECEPKRWLAVSSPPDGRRVSAFLLDPLLVDVEKKFVVKCRDAREPKTVVQSAEGRYVGIVMQLLSGASARRSRTRRSSAKAEPARVQIAVFEPFATGATARAKVQSVPAGGSAPFSTVASGDVFACGFEMPSAVLVKAYRLCRGRAETVGSGVRLPRQAPGSRLLLHRAIKNDGFVLIEVLPERVIISKLRRTLEPAGAWEFATPAGGRPGFQQAFFDDRNKTLYLSDSDGKIFRASAGHSWEAIWPLPNPNDPKPSKSRKDAATQARLPA